MRTLTWRGVLERRLARQHLYAAAPRTRVADVVAEIGGVHAQVMPSAVLSLGLRVRGFGARELDEALWERRELVKAYGLRGTVHLFPAREYGWWLAALRASARGERDADATRDARDGMTAKQIRDLAAAVTDALIGRRLTRDELGAAVAKRVGAWALERKLEAFGGRWPMWEGVIGRVARNGDLCFGPPNGNRVTFVRPQDWLGRLRIPDTDVAARELFRRYLAAYGPATERDFAHWTMMNIPRARALRVAVGDAIEPVNVEGETLWQVAGDTTPRARRTSTILLPRFDAYTVGSYPRDVVAPPTIAERAAATGLLPSYARGGRAFLVGPMPVLLVDGVVAGIWEAERERSALRIRVQPFVALDRRRRGALSEAAARLARVGEQTAVLEIGTVTTRAHL